MSFIYGEFYVPKTRRELIAKIRAMAPRKYPHKVFKGATKRDILRIFFKERERKVAEWKNKKMMPKKEDPNCM